MYQLLNIAPNGYVGLVKKVPYDENPPSNDGNANRDKSSGGDYVYVDSLPPYEPIDNKTGILMYVNGEVKWKDFVLPLPETDTSLDFRPQQFYLQYDVGKTEGAQTFYWLGKVTCFNYAKGFYKINISGKVLINPAGFPPVKVGIDFDYLLKCLELDYKKIVKPIVSGVVEASNAYGNHIALDGHQVFGLELDDDDISGKAGFLLIRKYDTSNDGTISSTALMSNHPFYAAGNFINCSFDIVEE